MISPTVRQEVLRRLRAAEYEHQAKVLLAIESGSRAWGFASPNSDYDARFIYVHPPEWYLSVGLEEKRDVIEYPIVDDMDINGWDLRKALRLFSKSNPGFVEWIQSPILYERTGTFHEKASQAARYDGANATQEFGWTYGIGSHTVPGRNANLTPTNGSSVGSTAGGESPHANIADNFVTDYWGISDKAMLDRIENEETKWYNAAAYAAKYTSYTGWNFVTAGNIDRGIGLTEDYIADKLTGTEYSVAMGTTVASSVAGMVAAARVYKGVGVAVDGIWGTALAAGVSNATYTLVREAGKVGTYYLTDEKAGNSLDEFKGKIVSAVTADMLIGAGMVLLPGMIGSIPWVKNAKAMWNSPSLGISTNVRYAQAATAADVHGVRNTLADTTGGEILKLAGGKLTLGVFEINIPHRATMTAEQADLWLKNSGAQITNFLDHNASLQDQAAHAANMSVDLVLPARNALADPHEAVYLGATKPPKTYEQLRATIAKENAGAGGDALDQKIIEAAVKQTKELGCFVAGTLVHTREGLRPIEQIQVGDYVLSKPESGDGETSYQPVTKTFSYENRELYLVNMTELDPSTGRVVNGKSEYVAVTGAHPIWVQSFKQLNWVEDVRVITPVNGWVSVEDIYLKNCHAYWAGPEEQLTGPDALVLLANGAPAIMHSPEPILKAHLSNEGVLFADNDTWIEDGCMGRKLLFSANGVEFVQGSVALGDAKAAGYDYTDYDIDSARSVVKRSGGHLPIRRTVYNLEVAHNHSYFVGELGMWVHNTSGLELRTLPLSPTQNFGHKVDFAIEAMVEPDLIPPSSVWGAASVANTHHS